MVCKEDVIAWFKDAATYRRIDVMCTLLNMCIPFELYYLGTYVEEQGKHDYQELRGAALAANNVEHLKKEIPATARTVLEKTTRHRLTLYISLLQSRNYQCAKWMYEAILRTDSIETFGSGFKDELLLLFTLALNHPAFNFEQKRYFGDVVTRLSEPEVHHVQTHYSNVTSCPPGLGYPIKTVHPVQIGMNKMDGPLPPPGIPIHPTSDFIGSQNLWGRNHHHHHHQQQQQHYNCPAPVASDLMSFPPPVSSPLVSQQSSPTASRTVSPNRMYTCRPVAQPTNEIPVMASDEAAGDTTDKNPWLDSMMMMGKIPNGLIPVPPTANKCQLYLSGDFQALSLDSDTNAPRHCSSSSGDSSDYHSPPDTPTECVVTPHGPGRGKIKNGGGIAPPGLASVVVEGQPPPPPTPMYQNNCTVPYSTHFSVPPPQTNVTYPNRSLFYSQAYRPPHQFPSYQQNGELPPPPPHTPYLFPPPPPPPAHYIPLMYSPAVPTTTTTTTPPLPAPKITCCYNCGLAGHLGADCKEPNIEEITQKIGYQLDYTSADAPPPAATSAQHHEKQ